MTNPLDDIYSELADFTARRTPKQLRAALSGGCYIYGAGGYGQRIASLLATQGIFCAGIIDQKFPLEGTRLDGISALHPDSLRAEDAVGKCLLIGVHNHFTNPTPFLNYGWALPFREILWNADLPDALGPEADNYWMTNRSFLLAHFRELSQVAVHLADQESQDTLMALLRYRITGDVESAPVSNMTEQYTPPDLLRLSGPITFVDGGAYNGDSYRHLIASGIEIANWIAFEPDPANFRALTEFAATAVPYATLMPCGLSNDFMHVAFAADSGAASHLKPGAPKVSSSSLTVPCVALDDVLPGLRPDYIKLDIEGAEQAALYGMRKTITAARPHLAISIYHRPQDLWELIETARSLAPYANLYLRQHYLNGFDTVLYAVPRG